MNAEFIPLQNTVAIDVYNVDPRHPIGRHDLPVLDPVRQARDRLTDDVLIDFHLREGGIGRRREVKQEDEEQRPGHGLTRFLHRRRGEVTHQDMRQRSRADHEAEDQREPIDGCGQGELPIRPDEGCAMPAGHARRWGHARSAEAVFKLRNAFQREAIHKLRQWHARDLDRHQDGRDQIGDNQHDILRHLCPGNSAHAAQHGADQNARKAHEHRDAEGHIQEALRDDANAHNLRHDINEGRGDQDDNTNQAGRIAAKPRAQEVRHGILAEFPQIWREQNGDQHVTAGPAQDEGKPTIAKGVKAARHADEACSRHPVRTRGHTVVDGGNAPTGDVIFSNGLRAADDADIGIDADGQADKHVAQNAIRHAHLFQNGDQDHEGRETARIAGINLAERGDKGVFFLGDTAHGINPPARRILRRSDSGACRTRRARRRR